MKKIEITKEIEKLENELEEITTKIDNVLIFIYAMEDFMYDEEKAIRKIQLNSLLVYKESLMDLIKFYKRY